MENKVSIGISNRHIHLTKKVYDLLFDDDYSILKYLSEPGEYVTDKVITLKTEFYEIENVKVLGPFRDYTQVEISRSDAIKFKINPPVRKSGDLIDAENITLKTCKNEVSLNSAIIAQRHIHISKEDALKNNIKDGQSVLVKVGKEKIGYIECFYKVKDKAYYELHLDTDDACAFLLNQGDDGVIIDD